MARTRSSAADPKCRPDGSSGIEDRHIPRRPVPWFTTIRFSCWSRRSCRPSAPTPGSTWSRPSCSAVIPTRRAWPRPIRSELEELIRSTGFFRAKARNMPGDAPVWPAARHGGSPREPRGAHGAGGVGRKTANVVLGTAFGRAEGVVVDTHVKRLAVRMGLTDRKTPEQIERDLMAVVPRGEWVDLSHRLIHHGRQVCLAREPAMSAAVRRWAEDLSQEGRDDVAGER